MSKYLDDNGLLYFWQQLKLLLADKVDKVSGKGLSTNDYTTAEVTKLAGIETGAEVNIIESILVNGTAATISSKAASISVPTKTSDLTNDSDFITSADVPEGAVATTTTPKMDGTAAVGSETKFARGDHIHPTDTSRAASDHVHGNITNGGDITTNATIANGDRLIINDESASKLANSSIMFGTSTTSFLANNGTWQTPVSGVSSVNNKTGAVTLTYTDVGAAASTHSHTVSDISDFPDISGVYVYKGSVATYSLLPSTGLTAGDVYNVEADGMNYAWTGTAWDALGGSFTITSITNGEIDVILAS